MSRIGSISAWVCAGVAVLLVFPTLTGAAPAADAELRFLRDGTEEARLSLQQLRQGCAAKRVEVEDPYYGRVKHFFALSVACVFKLGFGNPPPQGGNLFLRAADGYVRPAPSDPFGGDDVWLAFADAALTSDPNADPRWEPIDRRQVHPGPFYMVWSGSGQNDPHRFPWPYQLVAVELAPLASEYPHLVPGAAPGSPAARGFALFRDQCVSCHGINGEGGTVGPDLNVPQSIVEYRPAEQIRAYIRDPRRFRLTSMPSHRHLREEDLDALIAYFRAMSKRKYLPRSAR